MQMVQSWQAALTACESDELMVIGGGEIYALALPHAQQMHLTYVDTALAQADAYFPDFDAAQWRETHTEAHHSNERHAFAFRFIDFQRNVP
jgi:dihydrofolate reductase